MQSASLFQNIVTFINSDECNFTTAPGSAVVNMTEKSPSFSAFSKGLNKGVVPISETEGGKKLLQVFETVELSDVQEAVLWSIAEAKYIGLASGDIKLVAVKGEEPSQRFVTSVLPHLIANTQITSFGGTPSEHIRQVFIQEEVEYKFATARFLSELANSSVQIKNVVPAEIVSKARANVSLNILIEATDKIIEPRLIELSRLRESINNSIREHYFADESIKNERQLRKVFPSSPFYKIPDFFSDLARKREYASLNSQKKVVQREIDLFIHEIKSPEQMETIYKVASAEIEKLMGSKGIAQIKAHAKSTIESRIDKIVEHHRFSSAKPVTPVGKSEKKSLKF